MHHRLALLRVEAVEQQVCFGIGISRVHTHVGPNLPPTGDVARYPVRMCAQTILHRHSLWWHTRLVLNAQRFFYGYRPAVPVV